MASNNTDFWAAQAASNAAILSTLATNAANKQNVDNTNKANVEMNAATNQSNRDIASANNQLSLDIFNDQMDYAKAIQQEEWNRADSSLQRTVSDALSAGLSPLAALSQVNPTGQIVSQPSVPTLQSAQMVSAMQSPFIADNIFDSSLAQSFIDIYKNDKTLSSNEKIQGMKDEVERYKFDKQFGETIRQFDATLEQDKTLENNRLSQDWKKFNDNLSYLNKKFDKEHAVAVSNHLASLAKGLTNGSSSAYKRYTDFDKYQADFKVWLQGYAEFLGATKKDYDSYLQSQSQHQGNNVGGGFNMLGVGGANADVGQSSGSSSEQSYNQSSWLSHRRNQYFDAHPVPIYWP